MTLLESISITVNHHNIPDHLWHDLTAMCPLIPTEDSVEITPYRLETTLTKSESLVDAAIKVYERLSDRSGRNRIYTELCTKFIRLREELSMFRDKLTLGRGDTFVVGDHANSILRFEATFVPRQVVEMDGPIRDEVHYVTNTAMGTPLTVTLPQTDRPQQVEIHYMEPNQAPTVTTNTGAVQRQEQIVENFANGVVQGVETYMARFDRP